MQEIQTKHCDRPATDGWLPEVQDGMEESTLALAQKLARQGLSDPGGCESDGGGGGSGNDEVFDGSPKPLKKTPASKLEQKLKGFR